LPPAVRGFAGRRRELAALDAFLPGDAPSEPATVAVSAVSGTAGIGKTALAVFWAHRVAGRVPDGQLYVNLRGFDPTGSALEPAEAVRGFLDAFGVPANRIPASLEGRTGLYRSILTGRRVLVVLDNARDPEQVRQLLPGSPGCLAIVTSRNQLTPLVVTEGAHPLTLDLLPTVDAGDLLANRLGTGRVAAEPDAVAEIIARCARLPLALAVAAAHAATHPDHPLASLAAELREATGGLDAFDGGDAATDVRAVLSWSYRALSAEAARLFRLLGLKPGPDISTAAAASLAGLPLPRARRLLTELTRAHLLTEHAPGRYAFHDLLRAYATELAAIHDTDQARHDALHRILDHYLHTADTAATLRYPFRDRTDLEPPRPGVTAEDLTDRAGALAWFGTELATLLAAVDLAGRFGFDTHICRLSHNLVAILDGRGHWNDVLTCQHAALAAAGRLADRSAQAEAHRHLAGAYLRLGRADDAHTHLRLALDLQEALGNEVGQANCHYYLAMLWEDDGRHAEALRHAERALELYRAVGHLVAQAQTLNAVGWCHTQLGDHRRALVHCRQALALQREIGDQAGEADTLDSIGYAYHHLGRQADAHTCYQQALVLHQQLGDRYRQAETLTHLADSHRVAGQILAARERWRHALAILDELGHPDADQVRAKLRSLGQATRTAVPASA
jgi:tetratricopeptide (TPR) repeat protein